MGMSDLTYMTLGKVSMQRKTASRVSINKVASRRKSPQSVWLALRWMAITLLAAFTVAGLGKASGANENNPNEHWVGTWSHALHQQDIGIPGQENPGFNNQTHPQIVHISVRVRRVRVRLSPLGTT